MSVVVYETLDSMSGSVSHDYATGETREVRRSFVIGQCEGFDDAVSKIEPYAPRYAGGNSSGTYWRRARLDVTGIGNKYFQVTATYSTTLPSNEESDSPNAPGREPNKEEYVPGAVSWDTTGHTEHITQSLKQERFPADGAPDFQGAINVSGDSVQGIDVVRPGMRYSETWIRTIDRVLDCEFIKKVHALTGLVNKEKFRCFDAGEVLFMGARAQWQTDAPYAVITFDFEARLNGEWYSDGFGEVFAKEGWQYVWLLYETAASNDRLVQRPIAAYRETVYDKGNFEDLEIFSMPIDSTRKDLIGEKVAPAGDGAG